MKSKMFSVLLLTLFAVLPASVALAASPTHSQCKSAMINALKQSGVGYQQLIVVFGSSSDNPPMCQVQYSTVQTNDSFMHGQNNFSFFYGTQLTYNQATYQFTYQKTSASLCQTIFENSSAYDSCINPTFTAMRGGACKVTVGCYLPGTWTPGKPTSAYYGPGSQLWNNSGTIQVIWPTTN